MAPLDCFVLIFLCTYTGILSQSVTLSPKVGAVIENENITLMCSYNGTNQVTSSRWKYSAVSVIPVIVFKNNSCVAVGFLNNTVLYAWTCYGNNSFSLTIKKAERKNHDETWSCRIDNKESNTVAVYIIVPVPKVEITAPSESKTTLSEKLNKKFVCTTSPARPVSIIEWFISKTLTSSNRIEVRNSTTISVNTDAEGFVTTKGSLIYEPQREYNDWFLYCIAKNVNNKEVESNRIYLNITYAPDGPPVIVGLQNNTKYYVIENKEVELTCLSTGGNPRAILTWKCMDQIPNSITNETTVTSVIAWTASKRYTGQCFCISEHLNTLQVIVTTNVEVLYPPLYPVIIKNNLEIQQLIAVYTIENNSLSLLCNSSGNPKPNITWELPDGRAIRGSILNVPQVNISDMGKYICNATNEMHASSGEIEFSSSISSIVLKMLYPPTSPTFLYQNVTGSVIVNRTLDVVIGDSFKLACKSSGQPEPKYSWTWKNVESMNQILTMNSVLDAIVATCIARNVMNETSGESREGNTEAKLSINVLYPPKTPAITLQTDRGNDKVIAKKMTVIENTPFILKCEAVSKPTPSYSWYGSFTSVSHVLALDGLSREQGGSYRCHSYNEMKRTFGTKVTGENNTSVHIHVLYAPNIGILQNKTVIERTSINITCPVVVGNPSKLSVVWSRSIDRKSWKDKHLAINEVFRSDSATYTCTVNNSMVPTAGDIVYGINYRTFNLEVLYNASVLDFFVKGHYDMNPVIVDENTSIEFACNLASNPKPIAAIYFKTNILTHDNGTLSLSFLRKSASCLHSGVYKCTGYNTYNYGMPSKKFLTLHVRCFPRPSPFAKIQERYFAAEHDRLTISFTVLAYPIPLITGGYKWRKQDGYVWKSLTNSSNVIIINSGLLSNLTIVDVRQSDFGTYRLEVHNSIGIFEQSFIVGPKETPEPPNDFKSLEALATTNSLTVQWKPGLDGGFPQTFLLKYKLVSEKTWTNISIPHNGEDLMNYTINDLSKDAEYEMSIYAANQLGQSTYLVTLRIKTKGTPGTTSIPLLYFIIAGSAAFVFLLISVGVVSIIARRRRVAKKRQRQALVTYENGDALKQKDLTSDGRKSCNGHYDQVQPEAFRREAYEKLKTNTESLHAYQDAELCKADEIEQYQNASQFKNMKENSDDIEPYVNVSRLKNVKEESDGREQYQNASHFMNPKEDRNENNDEQESSSSQIKIGKAGQVVRFFKGTNSKDKKKDGANKQQEDNTNNDERLSASEQYQNLKY